MRIHNRPRLLLMLGDGASRARLLHAAARHYSVQTVATWDQLHDAVLDAPPNTMAVVDPYGDVTTGDHPARQLRALVNAFPSLSTFAVVHRTRDLVEAIPLLASWGIADLIVVDHDDTTAALRERLRRGYGRPLSSLLDSTLPPTLSAHARGIIAAAADVVTNAGLSVELAATLGTSRRTLLRACRRAQLPPPRRLLAWIRVLQAASLLDERGRTVTNVAHACGYSTEGALRRVTTSFVGWSPSVLRRRGAAAEAARAFVAELESLGRPAA